MELKLSLRPYLISSLASFLRDNHSTEFGVCPIHVYYYVIIKYVYIHLQYMSSFNISHKWFIIIGILPQLSFISF